MNNKRLWQVINMSLGYLFPILIGGCNVGPDYQRPPVPVPASYKETNEQSWKIATPGDMKSRGAWWKMFNDPILDQLEDKATCCNQSIAVAQAQYQQALAILNEAQAGFFPTISASVGDVKSRTQSLSTIPGFSSTGVPYNAASVGLQASWEMDLWGNIRRLVEADEAAAQASEAQIGAVRLSTQATLAQLYYQLRALDEAQNILDESVDAYEKFLNITKNQYKAGTASQLAILQANAQLQAIKAQSLDNGVARAQFEHAIAVLTNDPPGHFSIAKKPTRLTPPVVPVDVPSALLERRPDIANAERLMAQANAQIGVATSAFFPAFTLSGSRLLQKKSFSHLLSAPAVVWSLGAELTQTVFDAGAKCAAVQAADAVYQASVATYRQTVLTAFQDVEDNLSTLRILNDESTVQKTAVRIAENQVTYTLNQYRAGIASSLDVLNALFNLYVAKKNEITLSSRQMVAAVGLVKSLGGDYYASYD